MHTQLFNSAILPELTASLDRERSAVLEATLLKAALLESSLLEAAAVLWESAAIAKAAAAIAGPAVARSRLDERHQGQNRQNRDEPQ